MLVKKASRGRHFLIKLKVKGGRLYDLQHYNGTIKVFRK